MRCEHKDCFTCPYEDCIATTHQLNGEKKKPGRKKMDPEVVHQHRLEYSRKYHETHKEEHKRKMREHYHAHAEELREKQRQYRQKRRKSGTRTSKLALTIWVTNGHDNRRIMQDELEDYIKKGYSRGRT